MVLLHIRLTAADQVKRLEHDIKLRHQSIVLRKVVVNKTASATLGGGLQVDMSNMMHGLDIHSTERSGHLYLAIDDSQKLTQFDFHTKCGTADLPQEIRFKVLQNDGTPAPFGAAEGVSSIDIFFEYETNDHIL